jgi:hypothetical protein
MNKEGDTECDAIVLAGTAYWIHPSCYVKSIRHRFFAVTAGGMSYDKSIMFCSVLCNSGDMSYDQSITLWGVL